MEKITIDWQEKMAFQAHVDGFNFMMDAAPEHGGENGGMRPKPLMLVALAGCTGMDVASLAKKMRVEIGNLAIDVEAEKSDGMPAVYTSFRVIYRFEAAAEARDKILKIVEGSQEKYCGVSHMLRNVASVGYQVWLNGALLTVKE